MNNKYNILDKVFHITPESPRGVIIDISYSFLKKEYLYLVAWDHINESWCKEIELTHNKNY